MLSSQSTLTFRLLLCWFAAALSITSAHANSILTDIENAQSEIKKSLSSDLYFYEKNELRRMNSLLLNKISDPRVTCSLGPVQMQILNEPIEIPTNYASVPLSIYKKIEQTLTPSAHILYLTTKKTNFMPNMKSAISLQVSFYFAEIICQKAVMDNKPEKTVDPLLLLMWYGKYDPNSSLPATVSGGLSEMDSKFKKIAYHPNYLPVFQYFQSIENNKDIQKTRERIMQSSGCGLTLIAKITKSELDLRNYNSFGTELSLNLSGLSSTREIISKKFDIDSYALRSLRPDLYHIPFERDGINAFGFSSIKKILAVMNEIEKYITHVKLHCTESTSIFDDNEVQQ